MQGMISFTVTASGDNQWVVDEVLSPMSDLPARSWRVEFRRNSYRVYKRPGGSRMMDRHAALYTRITDVLYTRITDAVRAHEEV